MPGGCISGTAFIAKHLMRVLATAGVTARHIEPGSPSFNSHPEVIEVFPFGIAPHEYICFTMLALIGLAGWHALRPGARWVDSNH